MSYPRTMPTETLMRYIANATQGNKGLVLTDFEILHEVNRQAKAEERLSYRSLQWYKTAVMTYGQEYLAANEDKYNGTCEDMYNALMDNSIKQKLSLYERMMTADANESRNYKWVMERKYPDMNVRIIAQKEQMEYEMFEKQMRDNDLKEIEEGYLLMKKQREREQMRKQLAESRTFENENLAETEQEALDTDETGTPQLVSAPTATAANTIQNYAHLWTRPDGSRRTKEEFVRAVKAAKAMV